jgi:hypothetical protein
VRIERQLNLADMPPEWIPDDAQRRRVLVDNAARLYGSK